MNDYQPTDEQSMNLWFAADAAEVTVPYGGPLELGRSLIASPAFQAIIRAAQAEAWKQGQNDHALRITTPNPYREAADV